MYTSWTPELLAKYATNGPRYTSYPGAQAFTSDFSATTYLAELHSMSAVDAPISLYLHLPFCFDICYYCACNKVVTRDRDTIQRYLGYLQREMALLSAAIPHCPEVKSLHLGGGTPNYLDAAELTELVYSLARYFPLSEAPDKEFSIEIDPRKADLSQLSLLRGLGFNRISMGVQDFDRNVQQAVNRVQPYSLVANLFHACRDLGYQSINMDLIYGLPKQTTATFEHTLEQVLTLSPDRIAIYNYAHLPERFTSQRAIDKQQLPSTDQKLAMLSQAANTLVANGYRYIGLDHFVKEGETMDIAQREGRLCRNFQGYSALRTEKTLAMGVSSISATEHVYAQNYKTLDHYYSAIDSGQLPIDKGLVLIADDQIRAWVIQQICCNLTLDFAAFNQKTPVPFSRYFEDVMPALRYLEQDGLIILSPHGLVVTELGRLFLRNICMPFDDYVARSSLRFSSTV